MSKKINSILKEVLSRVKPSKEEINEMDLLINSFIKKIEEKIEKLKINAEIFVGGSFAKKTVIKKDHYDVDIFLRFTENRKFSVSQPRKPSVFGAQKSNGFSLTSGTQEVRDKNNEEISELTKKVLAGVEHVSLVHGSRDYFKIKLREDFFIELIPVIKIKKPGEALNITDLSYSHVSYIKKRIKPESLLEEVMLAKAFCYANHCYGAESYIKGFSGYAIELLIYYYGSFLKFISAIAKAEKEEKIIIDIEKDFKNKKQILMDLNSSKLDSPIILIDPTYKQRNALAALSKETFEKFRDVCIAFLKKPSLEFFEEKKTDIETIKKMAEKKKFEFILLEARTDRQEGDIAGSKLLKFYNHLGGEIRRFFDIKDKGFNYNGKKVARFYFVVKKKEEILITGPKTNDEENVRAFEKAHKSYYTKKGKVYAKEVVSFSINEFIIKWSKKYRDKIKGMSVSGLEVI